MPNRITSLELTGFRGATQITKVDFDGDKNVVMIFGENGTGKSTLVDAIDAVTNRSLGSVRDRKPSGAPWQFLPSLNGDADDLGVKLKTRDGREYRARLSGRDIDVDGPDSGPQVHVLRRNQLLKMTEEPPAERYKAIEPFIDVGCVEAAEKALRRAIQDQDEAVDRMVREQRQAEEWLAETWDRNRTESETTPDAASWAESRVAEDTKVLAERARALARLDGSVGVADREAPSILTAERAAREANDKLGRAQAALAEATQDDDRKDELVAVLEAVGRFVAPPNDVEACPVCAQSVEADALRDRIQGELSRLRAVGQAVKALATAQNGVRAAEQQKSRVEKAVLRAAREVAQAVEAVGTDLFSDPEAVAGSLAALGDDDPERALSGALALVEVMARDRSRLRAEQESITARVALQDEIAGRLRAVNQDAAERAAAAALLLRLKESLSIIEAVRKDYVLAVLDEIRDEVNRLYETIHPGEGLALEELVIARRASLTQKSSFAGQSGVIPQGYYSESHLDTLGFCFWIALVKRAGADRAVVVLDDVFTSVDWDHFERITAVLDAEAASFNQLIIATHSRRWYERYRRRPSNVHLLTLEGWSPEEGVLAYDARTHTEALASVLETAPLDRQGAASKAGVLLEEVLLRVATVYQCSLPLRETPKFTLSELFGSTKSVFKVARLERVVRDASGSPQPLTDDDGNEVEGVGWETVDLGSAYAAAAQWVSVRNETGAHYDVGGFAVPNKDVRTFAEAALELAAGLTCPSCGVVPDKPRDGTYRGCPCPKPERTKLTPLFRP